MKIFGYIGILATVLSLSSINKLSAQYWETSGNSISSGEFVGTNNSEPLTFVTNGVRQMQILPQNGEVGIGSILSLLNPQKNLHVASTYEETVFRLSRMAVGGEGISECDFGSHWDIINQTTGLADVCDPFSEPNPNLGYLHFTYSLEGQEPYYPTMTLKHNEVGIGITEPESHLHLATTSASGFTISRDGSFSPTKARFGIDSHQGPQGLRLMINDGHNYKDGIFVTKDAKVGIGTTDPRRHLTITSSNDNGTGNGVSLIRTDSYYSQTRADFAISSNNGPQGLRFTMSEDGGSSFQDALFLAKNTKVGVGTTDPSAQLSVFSENSGFGMTIERGGSYSQTKAGFAISSNGGPAGLRIQMTSTGAGGYNDAMMIANDGRVAINTTEPAANSALSVAGRIHAEEVLVELQNNWPDYVFDEEYKLKSLSELKQYLKINKHLPGVPSADEIAENGINLGEMDAILLEKIEELTLHILELQQKIEELENQNSK